MIILKFKFIQNYWLMTLIFSTLILLNIQKTKAQCTGECAMEHEYYKEVNTILPFSSKASLVTVGVTDEVAYYQGDIVLGNINDLLEVEDDVQNGVAIDGNNFRWENATIPYEIGNFSNAEIQKINNAAKHISDNTNLCVVPRTNETDYVFVRPYSGCSSFVGKVGGKQYISLSVNCSYGSTVHEFLHAAGIYHEQSRSDRDEYVNINFSNIIPDRVRNFQKQEENASDYGNYNFESIMHYGSLAFTQNGEPTITTIPPGKPIGQRNGLSAGDIVTLNSIYPIACGSSCSDDVQNGDEEGIDCGGSCPNTCINDCEQTDKAALIALYNGTDGANWSTPWDLNLPISQWEGITLDGNGCVFSLTLDGSGLNGTLPMEIGNLSELSSLNLINNNISGVIPPTIGNLSKLKNLYLHDNQLAGSIPSEIGALTNLEYLSIRNNQLTGNIPSEIGNLVNLKSISLTNNQLTGNFPASIAALVNLKALHISNNRLTGNISTIDDLVSLESLYLSNNQFTGGITTINKLKNLKHLSLSNNKFVGNIPQTIGELTNLVSLALNNNQFTGSIPSTIGNLTNITSLNLYENQLGGSIPSTIGNLTKLTSLYLRNNQLTGSIPTEIGDLTKLTSLSISYNQLTGSIPPSIGKLNALKSLYLNNNQLTGSIPITIGNLKNLNIFYLNDNQLTGSVPPALAYINTLSVLKIQTNQLNNCFFGALSPFCDQLESWSSTNTYISNGNFPGISWEAFCQNNLLCGGDRLASTTNTFIENYPNPFKNETTINYTLEEKSNVSITIYNVLGEQVDVLIKNKQQQEGKQTTTFNGTNYPAGIYYCKVQTGDDYDLRKMILVK